ncbi:head-tail adaptor protein [Mesorhizobium waimense]|uniref:Head-tail adaptor protein n=1 Tax=Mesorhizobium waimense TaxID=1300307 RepID=A0A3A5KAX9_9HYPH|nr:phage head closure protein [Mesorhizobium waimense]RJT32797.1 head-tail adaptor protein [Mesorhizobium waimense]
MTGAGDLDRRIELQSATINNSADYNEEVLTWATYASPWAKMEFHSSTESEASARQYAEMGLFFTIRWRPGVDPKHRLIFEDGTYEILGRPREIGRRQFLKLQARLIE